MYYIDLSVTGQQLKNNNKELKLVKGTKGLVTCRFTFTDWNDFTTKTAIFKNTNDTKKYPVTIVNNTCIMPEDVLQYDGFIRLSIEGKNSSQVQRTIPLTIIKQLDTI